MRNSRQILVKIAIPNRWPEFFTIFPFTGSSLKEDGLDLLFWRYRLGHPEVGLV